MTPAHVGVVGVAGSVTVDQKKARSVHFKVTASEVLLAVESLYADRLQPFGRILLKRLSERALEAQIGAVALQRHTMHGLPLDLVPQIDKGRLRRVCEKCKSIQVVAEEGGEYTALLVGRGSPFIDACSAEDPFSEIFWTRMKTFFCSAVGRELRLPGGRYACAQALVASALPFLGDRCLGEVCHIVQLAISHRNMLGYDDGHVVPYDCSEAVIKQRCAALQRPVTASKKDNAALPVAGLEQARDCLKLILSSSDRQACEVPLPNVKRLFRSRFSLELSETSLGHSRLCDLLQDDRFSDICSLRFHGNGYIVLPRVVEDKPNSIGAETSDLVPDAVEVDVAEQGSWESSVSRTFLHFARPQSSALRRTRSLPMDHRPIGLVFTETRSCASTTDCQSDTFEEWPQGLDCNLDVEEGEIMELSTPSPRCSPSGLKLLSLGEDRFSCFDTETLQYEHEQSSFAFNEVIAPVTLVSPMPYQLSLYSACQIDDTVLNPSADSWIEDASSSCSSPLQSWESGFSADSSCSVSPRSQADTFRSRTPSPEYLRADYDKLSWRELPSVSLYCAR